MQFIWGIVLLVASSTLAGSMYCGSNDDEQGFVYHVPKHTCPCNAKSAGALRYHDNHIQFCNGKTFVDLGAGGGGGASNLGTKDNPAPSCLQILRANPKAKSGVFHIKSVGKTYCFMEKICGLKGWAMIMKIDGTKPTFLYKSAKWTDKHSYNEAAAAGGLDNQEVKLATYHNLPFTKLCLGMKTNGNTKWLRLDYEAKSLYDVIHGNAYKATHLGRKAWKDLIPGSSLQLRCNKEGFNVHSTNTKARIGILGNQENECNSPDSRIGFGTGGSGCGQDEKNSAGNEGRCEPDNGIKSIKSFGYIFAQGLLKGALLGSHDKPAPSCRAIKLARSASHNGVYYLKLHGKTTKTFCYMDEICGSKGWTLIMKMDGNKKTFKYNSAYWTNKAVFNLAGVSGGLDNQETKLKTYSDLAFNALCLGMKTGHTLRWLKLAQKASSLYSLIAGNKYKATRLGRGAWKTLVPNSSLQPHCNKEGLNVHSSSAMARIGIISNQENDCNSPDSRIGFGTAGSGCSQNDNNSAGNEARCDPDNGIKGIKSLGFIFAQ